MSRWTHVAGIIRYDDLRIPGIPGQRKAYEEALGPTCTFDDDRDAWDRCTAGPVPFGSEGSLQWKLVENPHEESAAAYVVTIWGDLRNYDDLDEIGEWLKRCTMGEGFFVRQAIIYAEVEGGDFRTWVYRDEKLQVMVDEPEKSEKPLDNAEPTPQNPGMT